MGQELRDKYPIYPRSCPQEGEVGHTIDRCISLYAAARIARSTSISLVDRSYSVWNIRMQSLMTSNVKLEKNNAPTFRRAHLNAVDQTHFSDGCEKCGLETRLGGGGHVPPVPLGTAYAYGSLVILHI